MVLTEVNLLTGYVLSGGYEDALRNGLGIAYKKQEYKNNALSVYLDGVSESVQHLETSVVEHILK